VKPYAGPPFHPLPDLRIGDDGRPMEDGPERDQHFTALNNSIWGEGGWVKCYECPPDRHGNPVFHDRAAHLDGVDNDG
jgi:hypothetical protein